MLWTSRWLNLVLGRGPLQVFVLPFGLALVLTSHVVQAENAGPTQPPAAKSLSETSLADAEAQKEENPLQAVGSMEPYEIEPGQSARLVIKMSLPEGYKAYQDMFDLTLQSPSGLKIGKFTVAPTIEFYDEFSKKNRVGFEGSGVLTATIEMPESLSEDTKEVDLLLTYQACTKTYCLFPKKIPVEIPFKIKGAAGNSSDSESTSQRFSLSKLSGLLQFKAEDVSANGLLWTFLIVFVAGFLTSLTPCIFPMIPITLAVLGREAHARTKWQQALVSHAYILGIALTYAGLGLLAASTGALFGSFMNSPFVLGGVIFMFTAMAFSMFGFYEIQPPVWVRNKLANQQGHGLSGAFLTGMVSGIVASPCVGPVLVGILTFVAKTQNLVLGFSLLFVFALGMGQLFLILGMFSQATRLLPKSGEWMENIKKFFGVLMLGGAFYFLQFLAPEKYFVIALGVTAIILGVKGGAFDRGQARLRRAFCLALFVFGIYVLAEHKKKTEPAHEVGASPSATQMNSKSETGVHQGSLPWHNYSEELLAKAKSEGRPVMIDFYADWCAACKELESKTFNQPEFIKAAERFYLIRFDATNESTQLNLLREKFEILGLPTVVFLDSQGNWVKDATVIAFQDAAYFKAKMDSVK